MKLLCISLFALVVLQSTNGFMYAYDDTQLQCGSCSCRCTNGGWPYQVNTPTTNGCGGAGTGVTLNLACCNKHDTCYGTAMADKDGCDDELLNCAKHLICDPWPWYSRWACEAGFELSKLGEYDLGCNFYVSAQKNNVGCRRFDIAWKK